MSNDRDSVLSFAFAEEETVYVIDRSTLERFATCPAQARLIESGAVLNSSMIAEAGQAVHQAFSETIGYYMDEPTLSPGHLADIAMTELRSSRPDVQPEALAAGKPTVWAWAKMLSAIHPNNIIRYDGGQGDRSGQLAVDVPAGDNVMRVTSEVDLLVATESPDVVREIDYKSGWKRYSIEDVASSFQFQLHAWLILQNYPEVQAVQIKVWNCRTNELTYPVLFDRKRFQEWNTRIMAALGEYDRYRNTLPQAAPTWPAMEKCSICPAAALCPSAGHVADVASDPGGFVDAMVSLQARLDAMEKLAASWVEANGRDIQSPSGAAFGFNKPKANRKPTKGLYSVRAISEEDNPPPQ